MMTTMVKNSITEKPLSKRLMLVVMALVLSLTACQNDQTDPVGSAKVAQSMEEVEVPDNFNYETTTKVQVNLNLQASNGSALKSVKVGFYNKKASVGGELLASAISNSEGKISATLSLPTYLDSISIRPNYIGLVSEAYVEISGEVIDLTIGGPNQSTFSSSLMSLAGKYTTKVVSYWEEWYKTLGEWDSQGVPDYLEKHSDHIKHEFLQDLNATLPEGKTVPDANPEYLADKNVNTRLKEKAEVWVTFVHEGAGWLNALGFYTYDLNNPPSSPEEIDSLIMVFPNASYKHSGGGLHSGDKVKLGVFEAGTGIGWFLVPDGWNSWFQEVIKTEGIKWSDKSFNTFTSSEYSQHMVALKDVKRELILLGFEDTSRPSGDNDFNDCIFYVTANPFTAVITDDIGNIKTSVDTDKDGVDDYSDEYPEDPERAYNSYSPAKDVFGTLAYEDLWPSKGDYDFNDIVVDYNHQLVMNADNKAVDLISTFKTRAIGGTYKNGFGYQLNISPEQVESVTGTELTQNYISTNANGTEAGQKNAVVIVYDNAYDHMSSPSGYTVNAVKGSPFVEPYVSNINMHFISPVAPEELGNSPYNPFIISNLRRGYEIHLPGQAPSTLVDETLFGTLDDRSLLHIDHYYKTTNKHPWAIHLPEKFDYPSEKSDIVKAYYYFVVWAESGGHAFPDWYQNIDAYRDEEYIY